MIGFILTIRLNVVVLQKYLTILIIVIKISNFKVQIIIKMVG